MGADHPDDLNVERSFTGRRRRRLGRRASPGKIDRYREFLAAEQRRHDADADEASIYRRADAELARVRGDYPAVVIAALDRVAPSSQAPRGNVRFWPELAAALSFPECTEVLHAMSRTPSRRGPVSDLSGAASSLVLEAANSGANNARETFDLLTTSVAANWALEHPKLPDSNQRYRARVTITGRGDTPGHNPTMLVVANIRLIRRLGGVIDEHGRPCHPRLGHVGIVDGQRLVAPVEQIAPRGPGYIRALRRPGMDLVAVSTYERNKQYDTVIGWKLVVIVDQATMLPLVWKLAAGNADERAVLLDELLPTLFRLWPDCPMRTLVGDAHYDTRQACQTLEECYSLHPLFTRPTKEPTTRRVRGGRKVKVVDGRPHCRCGSMKLRGRDGFYSTEQRLKDGRPRGALAPNVKEACVRWDCPNGLCAPVSLWHKDDPRNHTWWPRGGESKTTYERVALEIYRNGVESAFSGNKRRGVGTYDMRALSLRDAGVAWVSGWGLLLHTARRAAHETSRYGVFHDEFIDLGLHRTGDLPNSEQLREMAQRRDAGLRWQWPAPTRASEASEHLAA